MDDSSLLSDLMEAMSTNPRVQELARRWRELQEQGEALTPERLCHDCPELLGELLEELDYRDLTGASLPTKLQGSSPPPPPEFEKSRAMPAGDVSPRYRPLRFHAKGGLGEVFLAEDEELHREVALKRLQANRAGDLESRRRFLLEAEITGRLEHPGVVPVYGLMLDPAGSPCYAMRFIEGETLQEAIDRCHGTGAPSTITTGSGLQAPGFSKTTAVKPEARSLKPEAWRLALRQLLARFVQVCNTLAYAHSRGILHRDLKPSNIMLGKYGETLVMDWGLAKPVSGPATVGRGDDTAVLATGEEKLQPASSLADSATETGRAIGTPAYMSPEQARGSWDKVGPASDIYGLGATLYAILTGQPPFLGRAPLDQVRRGQFPPPRRIRRQVPRPLEGICLKAMALYPADRYASALELSADVERWLADEPVSAWKEPWPVKARRWIGRHRTWVLTGVAAVVVAAVVLAWSAVLLSLAWRNERAARTDADEGWRREHAARTEADTAWRSERAARTDADEGFRVAREAVERYFTETSDDLLLNQPGMDELRKKMLAAARDYYERFVKQRADDPSVQADLGRAYWRLAFITGETESKLQAVDLYRKAIAVFRRLAEAEPHQVEHQAVLGKIHNDLGFVEIELSRHEAAEHTLREALRWFQPRRAGDADPLQPAYQRGLAAAHHNLGLQYLARRRPADAAKEYQTALEIRERLAAKHPDAPLYQRELAATLNNLGVLHRQERRPDEAIKTFEEALRIRRSLALAHPHVAKYQDELANTLNNLSLVHGDLHEADSRIEAQEQAVAIWERLCDLYPHALEYQNHLVGGLNTLGFLHGHVKAPDKAEAAFKRAVAILEKLTRERPEMPELGARLGGALCNLANQVKDRGKPADSILVFDRAERTLKELLTTPAHARAEGFLRNTYMGRAEARALVALYAEALADWDKAIELTTEPGRDGIRIYRAGTLARMGEHVKAAEVARSLTSAEKTPAAMIYNSACVYALCSTWATRHAALPTPEREKLAEDYALLALKQLHRAQAAGFLKSRLLQDHLREDADLDSLRQRQDFKKLLEEVGIKPNQEPRE